MCKNTPELNYIPDNPLKNKVVYLDGIFVTYTKSQMYTFIESFSCNISTVLHDNVDYLIVGDNPGIGFNIAQVKGIECLFEHDILSLANRYL